MFKVAVPGVEADAFGNIPLVGSKLMSGHIEER